MSIAALTLSLAGCSDYLDTSSPGKTGDEFVTSTISETAKTLSWVYATYRQSCLMGTYAWNDPIGSDVEYYPEENSSNNANARLKGDQLTVNSAQGGFNNLYSVLARASRIASLIAEKPEYQNAISAGNTNGWTQLYGEAITLRALCYFDLIKHFGDVPYGYENNVVDDYELTSRFDIYDYIIEDLKAVEPYMYNLGENSTTAETVTRTFANALIGQAALYSGGYQTIRTDVDGLYGDVQFTRASAEENGAVYARRTDYQTYYQIAEQYLQAAINNRGTASLITTDERNTANNPFQRHFQYLHDLEVSPESILEAGVMQGSFTSGSHTNEFGYAFGRPSSGGSSNAAPPKVFGAVRIMPMFFYSGWDEADKRRDVSITVTGSGGIGNEVLIPFAPGNTSAGGGISINKWDPNRMNPPYVASQRQTGINWVVMRYADVLLMQAETKAVLGKDAEAIALLNQIRERGFGDSAHNLSGLTGDELTEAILDEYKFEFLGEGQVRRYLIRSGKFIEKALEAQEALATMLAGLERDGYYTFANGNTIPSHIYTKYVERATPLTFDAVPGDPVLYPGWRGQYDYSNTSVAGNVTRKDNNLAIEGLFEYIAPNSSRANALLADGYQRVIWGEQLVTYAASYKENLLSGITATNTPPRYFWPIPYETLSQSKGKITNGYGLPQQ